MRSVYLISIILVCGVASCQPGPGYVSETVVRSTIEAAVATAQAAIRTPSAMPTITLTGTSTATLAPTQTRTPTATFTPTLTPLPPKLNAAILGCNTGFDLTHGMGEVTNGYARVRNVGGTELTNVCLTLSANDEGQKHPDKAYCTPVLKPNSEIIAKLTIDTEYRKLTSIDVTVTTNQGLGDKVSLADCRTMSNADLNQINPVLKTPRPIPTP